MHKIYIRSGTEIKAMISQSPPPPPTTRNGFPEEISSIIYQGLLTTSLQTTFQDQM